MRNNLIALKGIVVASYGISGGGEPGGVIVKTQSCSRAGKFFKVIGRASLDLPRGFSHIPIDLSYKKVFIKGNLLGSTKVLIREITVDGAFFPYAENAYDFDELFKYRKYPPFSLIESGVAMPSLCLHSHYNDDIEGMLAEIEILNDTKKLL